MKIRMEIGKALLLAFVVVSLPASAIKVPGGATSGGGREVRGDRGPRGSSANMSDRGMARGNVNMEARGAGGKRAATLGAVVNVHEGLNKVYHEYCEKTPGIVTNILAKTDGYCTAETLQPKTSEEIFDALEDTALAPTIVEDGNGNEVMVMSGGQEIH